MYILKRRNDVISISLRKRLRTLKDFVGSESSNELFKRAG